MGDDLLANLMMERRRCGRLNVLRQVEEQMKCREKYSFSVDWFSRHLPSWNQTLMNLRDRPIRALEIGCYEGAATTWLLDHILTHPDSRIDVCDTFGGNADGSAAETTYDSMDDVHRVFMSNVEATGNASKVVVNRMMSGDFLHVVPREPRYDLVYIDGSHVAKHVLEDAVGVWPRLRNGGILIFDDYCWDLLPNEWDRPKIAIDAFLACYKPEIELLHRDLQIIVKKQDGITQLHEQRYVASEGERRFPS